MQLKRDSIIPWGCVFKITFPNKKIYIGSDTALTARLDYFKYFGSPRKAKPEMLADMGEFLIEKKLYVLKKEILYVRENVTVGEILQIEHKFIKSLDAKNPNVGYNR
ncbi:MAG: GIY-YIG nuclease family protein [Candidatus Contendobacter sp.]|nr:GIY-YIG nuclease family protein [Candidatus Contendobacter sp.]MDG4556828.1 GIY-YIG nuclease family protein [Candidatus Contendobacter sp.]